MVSGGLVMESKINATKKRVIVAERKLVELLQRLPPADQLIWKMRFRRGLTDEDMDALKRLIDENAHKVIITQE